jgi:hypothetical protein
MVFGFKEIRNIDSAASGLRRFSVGGCPTVLVPHLTDLKGVATLEVLGDQTSLLLDHAEVSTQPEAEQRRIAGYISPYEFVSIWLDIVEAKRDRDFWIEVSRLLPSFSNGLERYKRILQLKGHLPRPFIIAIFFEGQGSDLETEIFMAESVSTYLARN